MSGSVVISGTLARDAVVSSTPGKNPHALVHVVLEQGENRPHVIAMWDVGQGNAAAYTAGRFATGMRKGKPVKVYGSTVAIAARMPLDVQVLGVTLIERLDLPKHHSDVQG